MSFWQTSDGKTATQTTGAFESGGSIELIPENTTCLAMITEAKIDLYNGESFINLTWTVAKPDAYKNRKVFQKVRIFDEDNKKRDKALQMLAAIDKNAGGKLSKSDKAPDDAALVNIMQKPMLIKVMTWEMDTEKGKKSGNWVSAVSPRQTQEAPAPAPIPTSVPNDDDFDDIPF